MTTTRTDTDELAQQAAELAQQAAEARAKVAAAHAADQARLAEHQRAYDERLVAGYRASDHEAAVEQARADLDAVVTELPVTQALARYLAAQVARYVGHTELIAARGRLGMPVAGAQSPPVADLATLEEYVHKVAVDLAHDALTQQREQAHHQRNGEAPS
jgi:hypothetical protein